MTVYEKIGELQGEFNPDSCAFEIGEQLKDICRSDPACEKILLEGQVEQLKKQLETQSEAMAAEHREALAVKDEELAELRRQLAAVSEKGPSGADAALLKNETVVVLLDVQAALNKMHGCYLKANTSAPALRPLIKAQAEKLIASLHSNFGIDYV